ncbi:MAG: hypothetical protein IH597_06580 [Bacteroidales bacterium]|nr:hypothetical protein [Bacteroidales bacterium]
MKNLKVRLIVVSVFSLAILVSCNKERQDSLQEQQITVDEIVEIVNQNYLGSNVIEGDEQTPFFVTNEGLIDEYLASESSFENQDKSVNNRFIRCLKSVNLDDEQIPQARRALKAYENRNERIIQKHRQAFSQLHDRMENNRTELIRQLRSGEIDRVEFKRKMTQLRTQYQQALIRIKESNASDFSRSFRMLMQNLNNVLTERQWNAFTGCLRG